MKKPLLIIGTCIFAVVILVLSCTKTKTIYATKPDPTVNLTQGLLLYLPFSGNIADSSGNGNPTQAVGSVLTYDAHGYSNSAFGADGGGEKIYVTNNGSIKFDTAFSLSFAFMVNTYNVYQMYISMVDPATGHGPSFAVGSTLSGINSLNMGVNDITLGCDVYGQNDNTNIADTTGFSPQPGSWYNVIGIYHKGSLKFYLNGNLLSTRVGNGTEALLCPASQIIIGAWWNSDQQGFNGKMDNIRLYNRVLSPHEIALLSTNYQVTSNSQKPGLKTGR